MMEESPGKVRVMAGKDKEGLLARGSKWGIKRMEGSVGWFLEVSFSVAFSGFDILGPLC